MIVEYLTQFFENLMEIFTQGGIITYIILFIGIYGLLVSLRKIVYLKKISKVDTTEILGIVSSSMERGGAVEALKQINSFKNPISKIISETLKIGYKNKTEVEESMEQIFIVEVSKMTKGLNSIKTIIELALFVAIVLLPLHTYIQGLVENEMDKIELATKMTNWGYAVVKVRVEANVECALEALQEAEGVVNTRLISDPYANIKVSFKPSMLDKSISNIILEKCNVNAEIIESKLRQ